MGIYKRSGKKGDRWSIDFYSDGRRRRIGGFKTRGEAQRALEAARTDTRRGLLRLPQKDRSPSFQDFAEEYFQWAKGNKRSWLRDKAALQHLCLFFANKRLSAITARDVEAYKAHRILEGVKKATVDRELSVLRHLYNKAREWKECSESPVSPKMFYREKGQKWHIITEDEQNRLLAACSAYLRSYVLFALYTGFRRGQIISLKWSQVDFDKGRVFLPAAGNKDKRDHDLPLGPTALRVLRSLKAISGGQEHCFPRLPVASFHEHFKKALRNAGLDATIRFHDLRHTFVSRGDEAGWPSEVLRTLAQHASLQTTQKYMHTSEKMQKRALEKLETGGQMVTNGHKSESPKSEAPLDTWVNDDAIRIITASWRNDYHEPVGDCSHPTHVLPGHDGGGRQAIRR